ncbi:uncharacterized protein LOC123439931 [Hordeum vulgare subsp. vulgare]|uniref:Predicted protein n=1 Tax=Hordeum vulgare subsp. vulgare TaxID=112509 RepID=F2D9D3_HORVV|nr:uncharacterized protein LOC123439931 [Hordeum vulgare subsp. vulgare]BAJ91704.1 predicted protein [Hordeum vulgare subsp. vulgare]
MARTSRAGSPANSATLASSLLREPHRGIPAFPHSSPGPPPILPMPRAPCPWSPTAASAVADEPLDMALPTRTWPPRRCGPFPERANARGIAGVDRGHQGERRQCSILPPRRSQLEQEVGGGADQQGPPVSGTSPRPTHKWRREPSWSSPRTGDVKAGGAFCITHTTASQAQLGPSEAEVRPARNIVTPLW